MISYLTYIDNCSISRTVFDKFDFNVLGFDLDLWTLKVTWGKKKFYHSKGRIRFPNWLLWTPSLYLVRFSRYSTPKFLRFDLDILPLMVIWGQKILIPFESPYMTSFLTSMDTISLSSPVAWQFCSRGPPDPWGGGGGASVDESL